MVGVSESRIRVDQRRPSWIGQHLFRGGERQVARELATCLAVPGLARAVGKELGDSVVHGSCRLVLESPLA
jgi:hypothetical protein